jgi:methylglyoxal synthase
MRNIAVIAHDKKKPDLVSLLKEVEEWLWQRTIVATGRTAEFLEKENFEAPVEHLSPGKSGGYNQITEMIKSGKVNIVIFLRDHEVTNNHDDIQNLLIACNIKNIPLATNPASAKLLILGLLQMERSQQRKE